MVHLCPVLCLIYFLTPKASEKVSLEISIVMDNFCFLCIKKSLLSNSMLIVAKIGIILSFHLILSNGVNVFIIHTNIAPFVCTLLSSFHNKGPIEIEIPLIVGVALPSPGSTALGFCWIRKVMNEWMNESTWPSSFILLSILATSRVYLVYLLVPAASFSSDSIVLPCL